MKPRDMRAYMRQTNVQLIVGAALVLFVVGLGLIALIYGPASALVGLLCLLGGLLPVGAIALIMWGMDWVVKRANRD